MIKSSMVTDLSLSEHVCFASVSVLVNLTHMDFSSDHVPALERC